MKYIKTYLMKSESNKLYEYWDENDNYTHHKTIEEYIEELHNKIELLKNINGFDFYKRYSDDEYEWIGHNYVITAKPYQHEDNLLIIDISNKGYENIEQIERKLKIPKSNQEVNKTFEKYIKIITKVTDKLNERDKLIDKLSSITNDIDKFTVEINNRKFKSVQINNYEINGIPFNKIETSDIFKIFNKINKQKPEIFSAIKYNL